MPLHRRSLLAAFSALPLISVFASPALAARPARLVKSPEEWRTLLQADAYAVLFEEATERPFTSPLNDEKRSGTYVCAACRLPHHEAPRRLWRQNMASSRASVPGAPATMAVRSAPARGRM